MNEDRMDRRGVVWKVKRVTQGRVSHWSATCGCGLDGCDAEYTGTKAEVQAKVMMTRGSVGNGQG